jgi:multidrug efflux pump subunit AcrA (membrane-fusion protein)
MRNALAIDRSTRTLNVEVDVENETSILRPGAYVFVHFSLPSHTNTVTIPSNALLFRGEGLRVGIVRGDRVQLQAISVGHDFGNIVEITSGLQPNDLVILDPPDSLVNGVEVRPQMADVRGLQ